MGWYIAIVCVPPRFSAATSAYASRAARRARAALSPRSSAWDATTHAVNGSSASAGMRPSASTAVVSCWSAIALRSVRTRVRTGWGAPRSGPSSATSSIATAARAPCVVYVIRASVRWQCARSSGSLVRRAVSRRWTIALEPSEV